MNALTDRDDRLRSGIAVTLIHLAIGYALIVGLGVPVLPAVRRMADIVAVPLDPPPPSRPPPPEERQRDTRKPENPEGAAAPPAKKDTPTEIVAPAPVLPLPTPLPAAKVAGTGSVPLAGAAPVPGPGTGAGGTGNGLGSGLSGDGNGGGGGGGRSSHAELRSTGISERDYPRAALARRLEGTTYFRFLVLPSGRLTNCVVTRSSGHRELDDAICPLMIRKVRYWPARDTAGRPVAEIAEGRQRWELGPQPADIEYDPEPDPR